MKIAIVGSRDYPDLKEVQMYVNSLEPDAVIVSGGARGVDIAAEKAAQARGLECIIFRVTDEAWKKYGRGAGMMRNTLIVDECDRLVAFWDGHSNGTRNTITKAILAGKLHRVYMPGEYRSEVEGRA